MTLPAETVSRWTSFYDLSLDELYNLLKLRQDVFILEQASFYADIDGEDQDSLHFLILNAASGAVMGAIRLFADPQEGSARIGRVVIARGARGAGLGRSLMKAGIEKARELVPGCAIHLSAQAYLEEFYAALGFRTVSRAYIEDGIPHIDMIREA